MVAEVVVVAEEVVVVAEVAAVVAAVAAVVAAVVAGDRASSMQYHRASPSRQQPPPARAPCRSLSHYEHLPGLRYPYRCRN